MKVILLILALCFTSFSFAEGYGLTFYCSNEPGNLAGPRLERYCGRRKYKEGANQWFGLCIIPRGMEFGFGCCLSFPWVQDAAMDEETQGMKTPMPINEAMLALQARPNRKRKVGRNDPCACGSGLKFKKCCLNGNGAR